jgi:hypothetical protein
MGSRTFDHLSDRVGKKGRSDLTERLQSLHLSALVGRLLDESDRRIDRLARANASRVVGRRSDEIDVSPTIRASTMLAKGMPLGVELVVTTTHGSDRSRECEPGCRSSKPIQHMSRSS